MWLGLEENSERWKVVVSRTKLNPLMLFHIRGNANHFSAPPGLNNKSLLLWYTVQEPEHFNCFSSWLRLRYTLDTGATSNTLCTTQQQAKAIHHFCSSFPFVSRKCQDVFPLKNVLCFTRWVLHKQMQLFLQLSSGVNVKWKWSLEVSSVHRAETWGGGWRRTVCDCWFIYGGTSYSVVNRK